MIPASRVFVSVLAQASSDDERDIVVQNNSDSRFADVESSQSSEQDGIPTSDDTVHTTIICSRKKRVSRFARKIATKKAKKESIHGASRVH